jgi:hypothetical protein
MHHLSQCGRTQTQALKDWAQFHFADACSFTIAVKPKAVFCAFSPAVRDGPGSCHSLGDIASQVRER